MEGSTDSSSTPVTDSALLEEGVLDEGNKAQVVPVIEHVEDDVKKKQEADINSESAEDALEKETRRDEEISDDGDHKYGSRNSRERGHEGKLQDHKSAKRKNDLSSGGCDVLQQENVTGDVSTCNNGSDVPIETEAVHVGILASEVPSVCAQEVLQSETTKNTHDASQHTFPANIILCTQSQHESDNSRTTSLPTNVGQPSHLLKTRAQAQDDTVLDDLGDETATSTCTRTASSNSNASTITDYSSPEAFLISVSQSVFDNSQQNQSENSASNSCTALPDNIASNVTSSVMISKQVQSAVRLGGTRTENKDEVNKTCTKMDNVLPSCVVGSTSRAVQGDGSARRISLDPDDDLLSELDAELDEFLVPQNLTEVDPVNGLLKKGLILDELPEFKLMRAQSEKLQRNVDNLHERIKSMQGHLSNQRQQVTDLEQERESLHVNMKQAESIQSVHLLRIKELELLIDQQKVELAGGKDRQLSHDAAAKKAITRLQQEMILRVDQVKSMYEEAIKEKEAVVIKYAKSEKEVLDQKKLREALGKNHKELNLTVESLKTQLHDTKKDRSKLKHTAASKETEASYLQKEIDQLKEEVSSQGIKVKWAQNKLKTELDAHKETKVKLAKTEQRLTEAKEETEQIRKNCQEMIKTYQTSEEVKSNSLDKQLKVKHSELEQKLQEQKDHLEVHQARLRELDSLKKSLTDNIAELDSLKVKNKCLEVERLQNEELLAKFKELLNSQKDENRRLNRQLDEKKALGQQLEDLKQTETQLRSEVSGQKVDQSDLETELESCREKESELLQFTEKITTKNTSLSSENATLQSKASQLGSAVQKLQQELGELQTSYSQLSSELKQERQFRERESSLLTTKLNERSRAVEQLSIQLDEARDDNKTLRRKHVANTKDLTRQLQQAHKRLESLESTDNPPRDNISVGSRTSSSGSLDTLPGSTPSAVNSSGSSVSVSTSASSRPEEHSAPHVHDHTVAIATGNDYPGVDKGMLVDRIVRLQKAHQRKNDKIEFMQEHVTHLVEELKKKSKIIQQYIMRDEAGALVPVSSDINKAQISKQGGIMSSLYRSQQTDPTMTLDLSLEINRKLQAVLEDTLLKNITLMENIETLGQEIARLLKEQHKQPKHQSSLR